MSASELPGNEASQGIVQLSNLHMRIHIKQAMLLCSGKLLFCDKLYSEIPTLITTFETISFGH